MHVPYHNHPFDKRITDSSADSTPSTRRRTLTESETAPIRVSAYYDPDSITNARSASEIHALKSVIGAIVNYYEDTIRVIPVDGTFYMQRRCNQFYYSDYCSSSDCDRPDLVNCILYNGGSDPYTCQDAVIPDS